MDSRQTSIPLELPVADKETIDLARSFLSKEQLALFIANAIVSQTSGKVDTRAVTKPFNITERAALEKAKAIILKKGQQ